ncbi:hypothetical protein Y1Q_0021126 [Alligator mississippiensis]|uniref:DDE Tnp4 domain-containing protein n=1 Tax=Alligator mississippiensis TaxID=8496 RepID=A0A151NS14_ALLMI|nr:hypothetical protein Y1Q_0021126 [Alligator mississippiensis]
MIQQLVTTGCRFLPPSHHPAIPHKARYHTLCLPNILDWATNFHVVDEDEATQDAMGTGWEKLGFLDTWEDEEWVQTFHMHWATFIDIIAMVTPKIMCQNISMQSPFTPEKQVVIAILKLATRSSLHYITNQFGMGKSMAEEAIWEVCLVIQNVLYNCFICLINPQAVVTRVCLMDFFNCLGAIDGTHIPILCPPQGTRAFINLKGYFFIVLKGISDQQC